MTKENAQPITGCGAGDIAPYVFLCGDPERVPRISEGWKDVEEVCRLREYVIHTGICNDVRMSVGSTGVGGPSTAVLFEEMVKLDAHTFIRVGNSGALADHVDLGHYVVTTASLRDDGTSKGYVRPEYPAVAHYDVVRALMDAGSQQDTPVHAGVTWSLDAFYAANKVANTDGPLLSMSFNGYEQGWMNDRVWDAKKAGILNVEMESSTILTLAGLFGVRAGCICTVSDRTPWPGPGQDSIALDQNMAGAIQVATNAMLQLATADPK